VQRLKKNAFWPIGLIVFVWFVFSSPYFINHKVPYPSLYQVSSFLPWNKYEKYQGPIKNNAVSDVINQLYPWKHFTIEAWKSGNIPVWNPYSFSGTPHLANYQSAVFSPFNILFFFMPFIDAWSLLVLLQPLLAGIFTYLLLRELKVSIIGSLIGSVAFMFCGFMVVWMVYGTLSMAVAFLPLCLFAIERAFRKISFFSLFLIPLSLIISFFSGHFQTSLYLALYSFSHIVFKYVTTKNIKALLLTVIFYLLGVAISLIQILPSLELYSYSVRSQIFSNTGSIPFQYLITLFAPDFFGNPVTRNDWFGYYAEWASFIGIIPFMLAFSALFLNKKKKIIWFFFFAGITSLLLALNTSIQNIISVLRVPIFSTSIPSRIIVLFSFSFAILAGFGLDLLSEQLDKKAYRKVLFPLFSIGLFFIIWVLLFVFRVLPSDKLSQATRNLVLPFFIFSIATILAISAMFIKRKQFSIFLVWTLFILTAVDSLRFAAKWVPFDPKDVVFPEVPVLSAMKREVGDGRAYGDYKAYIDTYYHIPSIEGYDPLYSKRYGEFIQSAKTGEFTDAKRSEVVLEKHGKYTDRVLDLLGVNIIFHPISYTYQNWAFPVWENPKKYSVIYKDEKFQLFKNNAAFSRVKLFNKYEVIKDSEKIIKRFYSNTFDFRNSIILEEDPGLSPSGESSGKASIVQYTSDKIVVAISTKKPALLFLSDSYYPNWKVKVNQKEKKIFRADYSFRAIVVPEGNSTAVFYYQGIL